MTTSAAILLTGAIAMCKPGVAYTPTTTCVVDGDTLVYMGQRMRPLGYDTPEPRTHKCGGEFEDQIAARASARFLELMNSGKAVIYPTEKFHGKRQLVAIRVAGRDVGHILISEGLARWWPDGPEWWCDRWGAPG